MIFKRKMTVKIRSKARACVLLAVILAAGMIFPGSGAAASVPEGLYTLVDVGAYDRFTNNVDGYSLLVDKGMQVDMSVSSVRAVLENEHKRIEIYKQDVSRVGRAAYINYSNRFLANTADHFLEYNGNQTLGGRSVMVTAWSREKLSRVANDKNHYVCLEIPHGSYNYTVFIKATQPLTELGGYAYLAQNFSVFAPRAAAYTRQTQAPDPASRGWTAETRELYQRYFVEDAPMVWGLFDESAKWLDYAQIESYERFFRYTFPFILVYTDLETWQPNVKQILDAAHARGKTVMLTLQTVDTEDGKNMVYNVLNGRHDEFLRYYANTIALAGHPVLFRLGNEMNGDWCPYSSYHTSKDTEIFNAFYRYVYEIFRQEGATRNVIWVWNPNGGSFPDFKWNDELMYYPGDAYVDVVGMTAYNTGTYYSNVGERWETFNELYDDLYARYDALYGQPLMITEFASASMGGDKVAWVNNMFGEIKRFDRIKIAIWWNGRDYDADGNVTRSYVLDESPELMEVFRRHLSQWGAPFGTDDLFGH